MKILLLFPPDWLPTDTSTGKVRLLVSIAEMFERADPPIRLDNPSGFEIYGFHSKFSLQGDRLMLSVRWFPYRDHPQWDMFKNDRLAVSMAWVTADLEGGPLYCSVGPEEWVKGGHHATWFPDGKRISMNLNIDREGLRFVQVTAEGKDLTKMLDPVPGSGHPTVHPNGTHLITDTYTQEPTAFGDGTIPIRWVDLATGKEEVIVRINTEQLAKDPVLRVDPHPAWDRTFRYVAINGFVGGTRRVFVVDMIDFLS